MATFNLIRNSKVFVTTNFSTTNASLNKVSAGTGGAEPVYTTSNSQEIAVLDGFTFSQGTTNDVISISEAGTAPVRGQRSFNTALNPVEFSFSTYIKPYLSTTVKADEAILWNALFSNTQLTASPIVLGGTTSAATYTQATGKLAITGTGMTGLSNLVVGDIVHVKGITGTGMTAANMFNAAAKVTAITSTTNLELQYLTAYPSAMSFVAANIPATVSFAKYAWLEHVAVSTDTGVGNVPYSEATTARSNLNQLAPFGMIITVDNITYVIDNCALDQASIDFGLDGIATVSWTGKGTAIRQMASPVIYTVSGNDWNITGGLGTGTLKGKSVVNNYITNKLSTVTLASNIGGVAGTNSSVGYTLALTGGNVTIANNINYLTPANLGQVNTPIGYFTGARSTTGNLTAYLRSGNASGSGTSGNSTATLLSDMLAASATSAETKFAMTLAIGGPNLVRVEMYLVGASLQIPTIDAQAVMSTTINFTAQGTDVSVGALSSTYDIENTNDLRIRYFSS